MKYLKLTIILLGIIASFAFFNKDISQQTAQKMLQTDFRIEAKYCGCFGCWNETVTIYKKENKKWVSINSGERGIKTFEFTQAKQRELELILISIIDKSIFGYSTTRGEFTFENIGFRFKLFDRSGSLRNFFNNY